VKDYVLTLLVAAAVTYMLTPLVRRAAIRFDMMHEPRERDMHTVPVPLAGGVAMYLGLAAGLFVAYQIPQLRSSFAPTGMVQGLLLAGGLLVAIGLVDDRWGMSAITKAAGQVAAGAILVATGTQLNWLPEPGGGTFAPTPDQSTLLTILIVVATINAVNFIDGLDGLAAGIVAIAAVSFLIYYYEMTKVVHISALAAPALASALLTGVCLGFLPHNFHPARIFMGDTGAMLLGLVLAYAPISSITSLDPAVQASTVNRYPEIMPLLLPAVLLVIPYTDMLLAVVRRMRAGLSPLSADKKHLHHRLISIGHSQRASVLVMYLWAALFSGSVVWFSLEKTSQPRLANHHGQPVLVFVVITAAAVLALVLMSMPWLRKRDRPVKAVPARMAIAAAPGSAAAPSGAAPLAATASVTVAASAAAAQLAAERRLATVAAAPPLPAPVSAEPPVVRTNGGARGRHETPAGGRRGSGNGRSADGGGRSARASRTAGRASRPSTGRAGLNGAEPAGHPDSGGSDLADGVPPGDRRDAAHPDLADGVPPGGRRDAAHPGPADGVRPAEHPDSPASAGGIEPGDFGGSASSPVRATDATARPEAGAAQSPASTTPPAESALPARSVVGSVPPAVAFPQAATVPSALTMPPASTAHPAPAAGPEPAAGADSLGAAGLPRQAPSDHAAWPGRSRSGSGPPPVVAESLFEPPPSRSKRDPLPRRVPPANPVGWVRADAAELPRVATSHSAVAPPEPSPRHRRVPGDEVS
jgi:UDP-GlcNAc:undecaprenyl-phosphate/decaprenyl-phosphate GlcNAc-1-phosphate transferase